MNLEKYKNHYFEDGGSTTTKEYATFQNGYIKYLKEISATRKNIKKNGKPHRKKLTRKRKLSTNRYLLFRAVTAV